MRPRIPDEYPTAYTRRMRAGIGWLALILLLPLAVAVAAWLVRRAEPHLAFYPSAGEVITPKDLGAEYTPFTLETADGERLHAWHLPRVDARAQVIYFHGNGGNLAVWSDVLVGLWQQQFDVVALDYRGYGLSTGRPSEQGLYRDVDALLQWLERQPRRAGVPLIYWGRSLGTVMAAYAANRRAPHDVVLEAGFPSMRAVLETNPVMWAMSWLASYRFPTAEWMTGVRAPALVLHGDRDSVIPYRLGRRLYDAITGPKTFVTLPGGDHNEPLPPDADAYWKAIDTFVSIVRNGRTP
jgi:fermentation-respiration switch protein FrsA (DUF1100 family)